MRGSGGMFEMFKLDLKEKMVLRYLLSQPAVEMSACINYGQL